MFKHTIMKKNYFAVLSLVALEALALNSCDTPTGQGAAAGAGAGAIIGGLLGYQIEKNRTENNGNVGDLDTRRCRMVADGNRSLVGYDVRYSYGGNEYVARMDHNPGRRVVIGQDVNPDGTPFVQATQPSYSWR